MLLAGGVSLWELHHTRRARHACQLMTPAAQQVGTAVQVHSALAAAQRGSQHMLLPWGGCTLPSVLLASTRPALLQATMATVVAAAAAAMMMTAAPLTELYVGGCGLGASTPLHVHLHAILGQWSCSVPSMALPGILDHCAAATAHVHSCEAPSFSSCICRVCFCQAGSFDNVTHALIWEADIGSQSPLTSASVWGNS